MFSFFRKSKKEPKDNKETNNCTAPSGARNNYKEMCKNNIQNVESAPQCANVSVVASVAPTEVAVDTETASETKTTKNDENATMSVSSKAQVYANMLKTLDPPPQKEQTNKSGSGGGGGGVKPCGHGTIAIAPKIPLSINKRDNQATPPDSPKAEARNKHPFYKPPSGAEPLHNKNHQKYELVKTQPINDTVTGVMKLRVDIPSPSPPPPKSPPVESDKYVLLSGLMCYFENTWRSHRFDSLLAPTRFNFSSFQAIISGGKTG